MKRNLFKAGMFSVMMLAFGIVFVGCSERSVLLDVDALAEGLAALPDDSTPENPIPVKLKAANITDRWGDFNDAVEVAKKYIIIDLSDCLVEGNMIGVLWMPEEETILKGTDMSIIKDNKYIKGIILPDTLEVIGERAFDNCTGLTRVIIPDSVTSIGGGAFAYCNGLTSVTIPDSVTSIGEGTFFGCESLTSITVDKDNTSYTSENGILFNKDKATLIQYPAGKNETAYIIPNSIVSIGGGSFGGCSDINSITIPNGVTLIGRQAFYGCSGLTNLIIPDSVTLLGRYAFEGCESLTSITFDGSNVEIEDNGRLRELFTDGAGAGTFTRAARYDNWVKVWDGPYQIGDTGPAGGIIFHDQGNSTDGWRYLEAAPAETEVLTTWRGAVQTCNNMDFNGFTDWFLPNISELNLMYQNLKLRGLSEFYSKGYWSAYMRNDEAWFKAFSDGSQNHVTIYLRAYVRAIRRFTP